MSCSVSFHRPSLVVSHSSHGRRSIPRTRSTRRAGGCRAIADDAAERRPRLHPTACRGRPPRTPPGPRAAADGDERDLTRAVVRRRVGPVPYAAVERDEQTEKPFVAAHVAVRQKLAQNLLQQRFIDAHLVHGHVEHGGEIFHLAHQRVVLGGEHGDIPRYLVEHAAGHDHGLEAAELGDCGAGVAVSKEYVRRMRKRKIKNTVERASFSGSARLGGTHVRRRARRRACSR